MLRSIFLLCNPLESAQEQMAVLEALPIKSGDRVCVVSEYQLSNCSNIETVRIRPAFKRFPVLRGFFSPAFAHLMKPQTESQVIFFIHDEIFSTTMIHALFAKLFMRCRVFVMCMENTRFSWVHKLAGFIFARFVDCAFCPNQEAIEFVRKLKVRHVYPCALPVLDTEERVSSISQVQRIGFVGRLVPQKGLIHFCEAAQDLADCEFKVFGKGKLESELANYPVRYCGDYSYTSKDLDRVFSEIDLLVLPSVTTKTWSEQFGRVLTEAMDRGVLVIGSNSGAIPQVIGSSELIFKEKDSKAIIQKIKELKMKTPSELNALALKLKNRFDQNYSKHVIRRQIQSGIEFLSAKR